MAGSVGLSVLPRCSSCVHKDVLPCFCSHIAHARCTYLKGGQEQQGSRIGQNVSEALFHVYPCFCSHITCARFMHRKGSSKLWQGPLYIALFIPHNCE